MIKIMFVCHGNICRSPMAEFIMKDLVYKNNRKEDFFISSSATSYEEIGNRVHEGTIRKLAEAGISPIGKTAEKFRKCDYDAYDLIIGMDDNNIKNIIRIIGDDRDGKVYKLLDFCGGGSVADPWYTGDFDKTYDDIFAGCLGLFKKCNNSVFIKKHL